MRRYKKQKIPYAHSHFIQNSNYIAFQKSNMRFEYCLDINLALDIYEHIDETKERQLVIEDIK